MRIGALLGPRAILNSLQERKTWRQETWWVQEQVSTECRRDKQGDRRLGWSKGNYKLYAGETNNQYVHLLEIKTHSPLSSSNYLLFWTLPRLCTRKGVRLLPLNTSERCTATDKSLQRHNSDGSLQFLRHKTELNLLSPGTSTELAPNSYATYLTLQS